jgi:hypothetical protein
MDAVTSPTGLTTKIITVGVSANNRSIASKNLDDSFDMLD